MSRAAEKIRIFDKRFQKLEFWFMAIAGFCTIFLTFLVVTDVLLRYFFNWPIPGGVEGTELILPYIVFLGLSFTLLVNGHVRVSIIFDRLPLSLRNGWDAVDCVVGIAFFGLLTYYGFLHFWESFIIMEFMMAPIKLPWWVGKFSMPLGTAAITLRFGFKLLSILLKYDSASIRRDFDTPTEASPELSS